MKKILLLDDDTDLRSLIRRGLQKAGYDITEGADGKAGLKLFAQAKFDLVLTDIIMPETDGLELISALRKISPDIPIIAMSGGGFIQSQDYLRVAELTGASWILNKPFKLGELFALVARALTESTQTASGTSALAENG